MSQTPWGISNDIKHLQQLNPAFSSTQTQQTLVLGVFICKLSLKAFCWTSPCRLVQLNWWIAQGMMAFYRLSNKTFLLFLAKKTLSTAPQTQQPYRKAGFHAVHLGDSLRSKLLQQLLTSLYREGSLHHVSPKHSVSTLSAVSNIGTKIHCSGSLDPCTVRAKRLFLRAWKVGFCYTTAVWRRFSLTHLNLNTCSR